MEIRHRVELVHALARWSDVVVVSGVTVGIVVRGVGMMLLMTCNYALLCQGGWWRWDGVRYRNHHITVKNKLVKTKDNSK